MVLAVSAEGAETRHFPLHPHLKTKKRKKRKTVTRSKTVPKRRNRLKLLRTWLLIWHLTGFDVFKFLKSLFQHTHMRCTEFSHSGIE